MADEKMMKAKFITRNELTVSIQRIGQTGVLPVEFNLGDWGVLLQEEGGMK